MIVLLIDDDVKLADLLRQYLERFSIQLIHSENSADGLERLAEADVVLLDVMLPEIDGFETCRHIRVTSQVPIIMLTARGEVTDRVVGIELGADDYLSKPFDPRELVARIKGLMRRSTLAHATQAEAGIVPVALSHGLTLRKDARAVIFQGEMLDLTALEFDLLELFFNNPNRILSRDEIMNSLRGVDSQAYSRAVDVLVSRLRHKLEILPGSPLQTIRGRGYRWYHQEQIEQPA